VKLDLRINADEVVGAIAFRVTFLLPYPFKYSGSPNILASSSDADMIFLD
jgi:hypothetical protein